jgi:penicillin-insensitive murein endopeptidase
MAWRRGEVWLDTELLWFREVAPAPAFAGFGTGAFPTAAPAPGLWASRQRRQSWRRRRTAKRIRTAALMLSPAVMIPIAAARNGSGTGSKLMLEDPPSLTFRLSKPETERFRLAGVRAAVPEQVEASGSMEVFPSIEWHHATSAGLPYGGHLVNGTQLPLEGPNWVTWDPVTNSVPNLPYRVYGNEHTISTIVSVIDGYRVDNPDAPRVVVGDISFTGGGPMDEHLSHQNGLDVDIYYPRRDHTLREPTESSQIDTRLAQDLLDRFVAAGAQMIFVGYHSGMHGPPGVVIPYPNHENHMHVRFPPPGG